uniref:(California timema) hypothetical protein n=1 Tax=Timema californicum TaxID=61474 RepID=A0A7R9PCU8_TIMCA|nr:unnamed protein product [Timema californicum]
MLVSFGPDQSPVSRLHLVSAGAQSNLYQMTDHRLEWMKRKVMTLMDEEDEQLFLDMLQHKEGELEYLMLAFLDDDIVLDKDLHKKIFYVYKTYYDKIVQEEKLIPEEVKKPTPPPSPVELESEPTTSPKSSKRKKKGKESPKGSPKRKKSPKSSPKGSPKGNKSPEEKENPKVRIEKTGGSKESPRLEDEGPGGSGTETEAEILVSLPTKGNVSPQEDSKEDSTKEDLPSSAGLEGRSTDEEQPSSIEAYISPEEETVGYVEAEESLSEVSPMEDTTIRLEEGGEGRKKGKRMSLKETPKEGGNASKGSAKRKKSPKGKKGRKSPQTLVEFVPEPEPDLVQEPEPEYVYVKVTYSRYG